MRFPVGLVRVLTFATPRGSEEPRTCDEAKRRGRLSRFSVTTKKTLRQCGPEVPRPLLSPSFHERRDRDLAKVYRPMIALERDASRLAFVSVVRHRG